MSKTTPNRNGKSICLALFAAIVLVPQINKLSAQGSAADEQRITSSEELYELENLLKVEIFMSKDAWDRVRYSWRGEEFKEIDGQWTRIESDYEHQPADIVINGVRVNNVGIRKKGLIGSLSSQRPSLKVKFNKFVKGQEFLDIKDLTLNNNKSDAAQVRQFLSYEWFRKAGIKAPRCNFARVFLNGKYLGVYSNVEPLGKAFLKQNYSNSKGTLYEGTAIDFHPTTVERFEAKTNKKSYDSSNIAQIADLLRDVDNVDFEKLSQLVDLDQFMKFWTTEMMLGHWDGYAGNRNNYFVYDNPDSGQLEFLPWGTDGSFGADNLFISQPAPKIITARGRLSAVVYKNPIYRQRYLDTVDDLLTNWWNTKAILDDLDRAAELVRPHLHVRKAVFDQALVDLRKYIVNVEPVVSANLSTPVDEWIVPVPNAPSARTEGENDEETTSAPRWAGSVKSSFLVPFKRYDVSEPGLLPSESLELIWQGEKLAFPMVVGKAGYEGVDPLWYEGPQLLLVRVSPLEGRNVWVHMNLDPDLLAKGGDIRLHRSGIVSWFGTSVSGSDGFTLHGMLDGTLLAEIVEIDGEKFIKGSINANLGSSKPDLEF